MMPALSGKVAIPLCILSSVLLLASYSLIKGYEPDLMLTVIAIRLAVGYGIGFAITLILLVLQALRIPFIKASLYAGMVYTGTAVVACLVVANLLQI